MAKNLWKGRHGAQEEVRREEEETFPSAPTDYVSVGDTLRNRREERGEDLRYVAQILRIRYPYLKAIEDGQPDELPGPTYAVGFVRTYADHLDLPSEELVQRFKEEAANLQARADLHFPAPIPEGKIPSGAVLVIAVVLAAAVYAGWIYLSSQEKQVAEIVPQLPNRISEIIKGDPDASNAAGKVDNAPKPAETQPSSMTAAATPASPAPVQDTSETASGTPAATAPESNPATDQPAAMEPEKPPMPASSETPAESTGQSEVAAIQPEPRSEASIPAPPGSETEPSGAAAPSESPEAAPQPTESASVDTESTPKSTTEPSADEDRAPPKTYGEENSGARIVIHAAADSWVEVRDSTTDELLLTRVLFKGDRYLVPDREGLTLLTGNAGGLRIVVDGSDVPPIGPLGAVRRNVALEPTPLLSGNAARRTDGNSIPTQSQTSEGGFQSQ